MYRILLVEDDPVIAGVIASELDGWGYHTHCADDFAHVMETFEAVTPQLVLLDIGLPLRSGFYWCAEIRKISKVPIIFISSAADTMNMVTAIHQGADDFIAKPFDLSVLIAKVQALLRRTYDFATPADLLSHRGAVLDLGSLTLTVNGNATKLTGNEFRILQILMENKGHLVGRDALMRRLWESEHFIDDNTLTVNIARLRKKLDEAGLPGFITTKKGLGYIMEE